jgi:hypothetical protein
VKGLSHDLLDLEHELDAMKPPGRDLKTVRGQLDDTGKLLKKVDLFKFTFCFTLRVPIRTVC